MRTMHWMSSAITLLVMTCCWVQLQWVRGESKCSCTNRYSRCEGEMGGDGAIDGYVFSSQSYAYGRFGRRYDEEKGHRGFDGAAYLRGYYDDLNPFSSGISSYQGTSTGPGPNGGYPGTPRGVYKTVYLGR